MKKYNIKWKAEYYVVSKVWLHLWEIISAYSKECEETKTENIWDYWITFLPFF
jgi:hypothetical protein